MVGRSRTLLLLVLLTATALSGCTARGEAVTVEAPQWSPGYTWAYEGDNAFAYREQFGSESEEDAGRASYRATSVVVNTGMEAEGDAMYLAVEQIEIVDAEGVTDEFGATALAGDPFLGGYRQSDLKPYFVSGARSETCNTAGACTTTLQDISFQASQRDNEFLRFPLQTGDVWRGSEEALEGLEVAYTTEVGRLQSVETPLGPIDAVRIETRYRPVDLSAFIRAMEQESRDAGFDIEDLSIDIRVDSVYHYSPTYQNLVRAETHVVQRFSAVVPDGQGGRVEVRSDMRYDERIGLSGARLVPGPERTLEEVAVMLSPGTALENVTGAPVPESTYQVRVDAIAEHTNAFAGEAGRFEALLDGVDELPVGHGLRWSLQDRSGREVAAADGAVFEPAPSEPGRYTVLLQAVDEEGAVLSTAGAGLAAHYQGAIEHDCGPVNVELSPGGDISPCNGIGLPVHPGATSLSLLARVEGGTAGALAELVVTDAVGREVPAQRAGDAWSLELDSFEGTNLGTVGWLADWQSTVGAQEVVDFEFSILYGEPPVRAVEVAVEPTGALLRTPDWLTPALPSALQAALPSALPPAS